MWQTTLMAWRNIWRNTRRTLIAASAIGLGLATLLVTWSLMGGMFDHMVRAATASYLGHAEVHAKSYSETLDPELVIPDAPAVIARARQLDGVEAATPRALGLGLVAIGSRSAGVKVIGIDPATEPEVTDWDERIVSGSYPEKPGEALIGKALANRLEIDVGSYIVLTASDVKTGDLARLRLEVSGVTFTNNPLVDKQAVILPIAQAQEALGLGDDFHEIAMNVDGDVRDAEAVRAIIQPLSSIEGIRADSWHAYAPGVNQMLQLEGAYLWIYVGLIFFVISLGIVNTLVMSLMERIQEFGILRAIGTSGGRLAYMIFAEAASLGLVGVILGLLVFIPAYLALATWGLNMGTVEMAGVSFNAKIYASFDGPVIALVSPIFILLTTITALTTAIRAARIEPVEALRHV